MISMLSAFSALPAIARLIDPTAALDSIRPEAGVQHPQPQGLAANGDAVDLAQLLGGQGRPEVGVTRPDQLQGLGLNLGGRLPVGRSAALLGDDGGCALLLIGLRQPLNLAALQSQKLGGRRSRQSATRQIAQDLKAAQLLVAHDMQRHLKGLPGKCGRVPSLTGTGATLLNGGYKFVASNISYRKSGYVRPESIDFRS